MAGEGCVYKIRKLDVRKQITPDKTICICARRNSGKSILIRDIMYNLRKIPAAVIICPTELPFDPFYAKHIPSSYIFQDFNPNIVNRIFLRQKKAMRKAAKNSDVDPHLLFVMDDLAHDNSWTKDKGVKEIFTNGRHYKILYITAVQDPMVLKPFMRGNADLVFLLQDNDHKKLYRVWNAFGGVFKTFKEFMKVFETLTQNYGCMVINSASKSSNIEDIIFWYKAKYDLPEFELGDQKHFWGFHKKNYDGSHGDTTTTQFTHGNKTHQVTVRRVP